MFTATSCTNTNNGQIMAQTAVQLISVNICRKQRNELELLQHMIIQISALVKYKLSRM